MDCDATIESITPLRCARPSGHGGMHSSSSVYWNDAELQCPETDCSWRSGTVNVKAERYIRLSKHVFAEHGVIIAVQS
jgi:hypothetical protein